MAVPAAAIGVIAQPPISGIVEDVLGGSGGGCSDMKSRKPPARLSSSARNSSRLY
jgi:hypothetical protein